MGLSPRVRRHLLEVGRLGRQRGSISACAEAPIASIVDLRSSRVYLRVCGGTCRRRWTTACRTGLSPRVRRHPADAPPNVRQEGSISACAEAPATPLQLLILAQVYLRVCGGT